MITIQNKANRTKTVQMIVKEKANIRGYGKKAIEKNIIYQKILYMFRDGKYTFLIYFAFKISISECSVDDDLIMIRFHDREGMLLYNNLGTKLIQLVYNSILKEYPECEDIYIILTQKYFWPNMAMDIHKFTDNCDSCEVNKVGRRRRQGLLKSLSMLSYIGGEISMDFIMNLLNNDGCINMIVIIDRLSKEVIADGLEDIMFVIVVKWFLRGYFPHHSLPYAIVSDCEIQFVSDFWIQICMKLRIKRRLSIIYSPETDGSAECMNQKVENYLQEYVNFVQDNGLNWLDIAMEMINVRDSFSTEMSSFFMGHDWHLDVMNIKLGPNNAQRSSIADADRMLYKLQDVYEWTQSATALVQQGQEEAVNRKRDGVVSFKMDNKIWLDGGISIQIEHARN